MPTTGVTGRRFYRAARVANATLDGWLPDHAVGVADGKIVDVLPAADAPEGEVVDLGDVSLLPGLVEGHTHSPVHHESTRSTSSRRSRTSPR